MGLLRVLNSFETFVILYIRFLILICGVWVRICGLAIDGVALMLAPKRSIYIAGKE